MAIHALKNRVAWDSAGHSTAITHPHMQCSNSTRGHAQPHAQTTQMAMATNMAHTGTQKPTPSTQCSLLWAGSPKHAINITERQVHHALPLPPRISSQPTGTDPRAQLHMIHIYLCSHTLNQKHRSSQTVLSLKHLTTHDRIPHPVRHLTTHNART